MVKKKNYRLSYELAVHILQNSIKTSHSPIEIQSIRLTSKTFHIKNDASRCSLSHVRSSKQQVSIIRSISWNVNLNNLTTYLIERISLKSCIIIIKVDIINLIRQSPFQPYFQFIRYTKIQSLRISSIIVKVRHYSFVINYSLTQYRLILNQRY